MRTIKCKPNHFGTPCSLIYLNFQSCEFSYSSPHGKESLKFSNNCLNPVKRYSNSPMKNHEKSGLCPNSPDLFFIWTICFLVISCCLRWGLLCISLILSGYYVYWFIIANVVSVKNRTPCISPEWRSEPISWSFPSLSYQKIGTHYIRKKVLLSRCALYTGFFQFALYMGF